MTRIPQPGAKQRCAIYTRKSSEEGLDQAFNSLHAQREACEAYVKSQSHEGWKLLATHYDDGGFSGGDMDRPALTALLADIDAGNVDVVVVYKVDRLTRALADFAKIVERLDAAGASFVSVTQAFNTTTSMGRLTLNVLLSFAQFEREVTGERIRDKIAASKKKGMWMGGVLPLGYDAPTDPATRALVINGHEADEVRLIFSRYLELGSVTQLAESLDRDGLRSKVWTTRRGETLGGLPFSRGALLHLLKNRTYLGEIPHKLDSYPASHPAIIDGDTFAAVQALIASRGRKTGAPSKRVATMALKGRIFDAEGGPMSPTFGYGRGGRLYRYYASAALRAGDRAEKPRNITRVPAEPLETLVRDALGRIRCATSVAASRVEIRNESIHVLAPCDESHATNTSAELVRLEGRLQPGERIINEGEALRLILPVRACFRGGRSWLLTPDGRAPTTKTRLDRSLVRALRAAHRLAAAHGLFEPLPEGAPPPRLANTYERQLIRLAFLAPDIQAAILSGAQPATLTLQQLLLHALPTEWSDQQRALGCSSSSMI